ncbi:MAG: insulinase family protein [Deltaproteobacteria bacterium]|nr:MAG: insulinase family protein [Deltaproteobacteria bacterium]
MRLLKHLLFGCLLLMFIANSSLAGNSVSDLKIDVKEFQLENGMLFLIVERPIAPQVACRLTIRAGSALEEIGKTGIAHLLEHMMFKGTKNFGTQDVEKDQKLQEQIEAAYQTVLMEQKKRNPNKEVIRKKLVEMQQLRTEVQKIYVPQAFSSQLGRNGAVGVNAFTTQDQTQYIMSIPSDMLEQWFSIVSEQLFEPSWREFYVEKEVVQREWAFRYVNNPAGAAWLDLQTTAYTAHPYRNPVIGWKSDMEKYTTDDAVAFHQKHYNPANAVCVLVGDVNVEDAKRLAKMYFERYPTGRRSPEIVTAEPLQQGPRKSIRFLKGARTPLVRIGFHGARMGTKDFYALDAMTMVLSHGRSARLTQNIVNKGLAVEAWAYNPDNRYGGMIILGATPNEPQALPDQSFMEKAKRQAYLSACEKAEQLLLAEVEKMKSVLVTERELERIKKLNQRDFLERMRSNEDLAGTLATLEVQVGWQYLTDYLKRVTEITPHDIREAAKKYIQTDNQTSVYIIPGGDPVHPPETYSEVRSISGAAASKIVAPTNFKNNSIYPTPTGWKHPLAFERHPEKIIYPKAQTTEIGNTKVFYLPDQELPLVDLTILIKSGEIDLPDTKTGLSDLINSSLIRGGTENYTPSELALVLDENAIKLSVSVGEEDSTIHLSVMKEDWEKGLALLEEVLTRPAFNSEVLRVAKDQEMVALRRQSDSAQTIVMREGMIWHFKGHPYGRDPLLGLETIPNITREDLHQFIKSYFIPSNMVVAVSGDISKQTAIAGLKKLFKTLPKHKAAGRNLPDPKITPPVLTLIHKPGQVQSQVILLLSGVKRSHPDYWKVNLLMDIFGGNDSLMYTRLRDDLGLVYSAGFFQTYKWQAGILVGYIGCKGDQTATAILETLNIMDALRKEIPPKDLELKRLDALNSFVFNVDTPAELVEVYGRYHMRGEPLNTLERIQDAYISASRKDLLKLSAQLLNQRNMQIFIVADKKIAVNGTKGYEVTLEKELKRLAENLDMPYREIELR